ncbi:hypothetical protein HID58_087477, partial [Brassica napus]
MFFKDISPGPHETQFRYCLIHFWEARNPVKKHLLVWKCSSSTRRVIKYLPDTKQGSVYSFLNFYVSKSKMLYRVVDHSVTVSFSHNTAISVLEDSPKFYIGAILIFFMNNVIDVVGHIKLVNGQTLTEHLILDEVEIATTRRLLVHVQSHDEPVVKLYLWDQTGTEFCKKFKSYEKTPTVLLVTTANTKHLGALTSISSSRVFMDYDIQPTIDYFSWLGSNPEIAKQVNAEVVTKPETLTIGKYSPTSSRNLQSYAFHAIGFSFFHNGYRAKISVYDNSDQAVFVLLGDAGRELNGKYKSKLVSSYFQTRAITVTNILSLETPPPIEASVGNRFAAMFEETLQVGYDVCEPSKSCGDFVDEGTKRTCGSDKPETAKRPKCGNQSFHLSSQKL